MKRDLGYYVEANIEQVFNAYLAAASNEPFKRECTPYPFCSIFFGLHFSFKYNMNGGYCEIQLMPYGNGTAVNIHFSIIQAIGSRCEKYAQDLNSAMQGYLPVLCQPATYDLNLFLKYQDQFEQKPVPPTSPVPPQAPARFCTNCGAPQATDARFCAKCGTPLSAPIKKLCPNCNAEAQDGAVFCTSCGTRL